MIYSGRIIKIEQALDGSPMFTVANSSGAVYSPCFLLSHASGLEGLLTTFPVKMNAAVCLLRVDENLPCYIVGGFADEGEQRAITLTNPVTADANTDYTGRHLDEHIMRNGDTTLTLSPRNNFVANSPSMKMQLQGGKFRVSQQGAAENQVLNADPFISVLFNYLTELEAKVLALTAAVQGIDGVLSANVPTGIAEALKLAEINVKVLAGTATPAEIAQQAAILAKQAAVGGVNIPLTPVNDVRSNAEATANDHVLVP
jgi:hypothetical protein